jgi:hypothetical protein
MPTAAVASLERELRANGPMCPQETPLLQSAEVQSFLTDPLSGQSATFYDLPASNQFATHQMYVVVDARRGSH